MERLDASPHRLTTFPAVFPEEEEKNQVNQVISSLFSKVRSRFAPPTPGGSSSTSKRQGDGADLLSVDEERDSTGRRTSSLASSQKPSGLRQGSQDLQSFTFGRSDQVVPSGSIAVRPPSLRLPSGGSSKASLARDIPKPPALPRSLSSRPAPGPAPPLISTTPVIRSQDFAHYLHPNPTGSSDNLSTTANGGLTPIRTRERSDSRSYVPRHRHTGSASSFTRFRKPSITGSLLHFSPSSANLASSFQSDGNLFEYNQVPGFSIADDTRSIRTIDTVPGFAIKTGGNGSGRGRRSRETKEGQVSVAKIIRRLRGEGLSKAYWMADETCKECYDCKSVFSAWRRKHHCRICGQIFCSRCAPNIIKGYRFGVEGTVRVCNLCLELMNECDDEEDRRSVTSNGTSQLPLSAGPVFHVADDNMPLTANQPYGYSQSPFAASHLFRHVSHGDMLGPIREGGYRRTSGNSALDDRSDDQDSPPGTPLYERGRSDSLARMGNRHPLLNARMRDVSRPPGDSVPFRRAINEEETGTDGQGTPKSHELNLEHQDESRHIAAGSKSSEADPLLAMDEAVALSVRSPGLGASALEADGTMQPLIAFPTTGDLSVSPTADRRFEIPKNLLSPQSVKTDFAGANPPGALRTRLSSRVSTSGLSGVLLSDIVGPNDMWGSGNDPSAIGSDVLPPASLAYFRLMLRQILDRERIGKAQDWEDVLTKLLLQVASNIKPSVANGDSIDVRTYVKIKKIPGGKSNQSEYVDGTVITKNLEHKQMPRHMLNPRIMLLTFPIDYHRVESQLVSLEPLLAQEKNYLQHLTRRITDLRPHIVLVERNVSRLALDFLMKAKVSVARGVKTSAMQQVARCTQSDIIGSMDRLAMEPRLGRCVEFKVQTFEHRLIPGYRKTFMRFEGCHAAFGCTLILRGGDIETLQTLKRITDFMVLVIHNLKMEVCLFYDDFNIIPPSGTAHPPNRVPGMPPHSANGYGSGVGSLGRASVTSVRKDRAEEQEQAYRQSAEIEKSLRPYLDLAISSSVAVSYPPPAPIARMSHLDGRLRQLRLAREEAEAEQILLEEGHGSTTPKAEESTHGQELSNTSVDSSHSTGTITARTRGLARSAEEKEAVLLSIEEIQLESDIAQTEFEHAEQLKLWSWYVSRNPPDIRPESCQGINYLSSLVCEGSDKPCAGPRMLTRNFYMADDRTIGQYLEALCAEAAQPCPNKQCTRLQLHHFQVLVHGSTRLQIALDQFPCPSPGNEDKIITWSYCKVCKEASPTAIIKDETWSMSWSKYLEHAFYPPETRGGFGCPHDAYRDQIRYFALQNLAIRIHNEKIDIYEVMRPSLTLQVRQESRVLIKNQEYTAIGIKSASFFDSVSLRLRTFDCQLVKPENVEELRRTLSSMSEAAMVDRQFIQEELDRTYKLSSATDVLVLNSVYLALQDKVVQWDVEFQDLEKQYLPSEKDIRHMTATHLKRLFAGQDFFPNIDRSASGQTVGPRETKDKDPDITKREQEEAAAEKQSGDDQRDPEKGPTDDAQSLEVPILTLDAADDPLATPLAEHPPQTGTSSQTLEPIERDYDSESTISAMPRELCSVGPLTQLRNIDSSTSGLESDAVVFASRLPRRARPAPTVADLVRRFQNSTQLEKTIESLGYRMPDSNQRPDRNSVSDSEEEQRTRPRIKRGKTEGYHSRNRTAKVSGMSDGGESYALNASRIPTLSANRRPTLNRYLSVGHDIKEEDPLNSEAAHNPGTYTPIYGGRFTRSRREAPDASSDRERTKRQRAEMEKVGKGKAPARPVNSDSAREASRPGTPGLRGSSRRGGIATAAAGSRVSTIARHFDRLSKEAERDHVRRMNQARGRRARPVGVTRAKIHVFSNARDAFRDDESDSASSEADDEEDNEGDGDNSDKEVTGGEPPSPLVASVVAEEPASREVMELSDPISTTNTLHVKSGTSSPLFEPSSVTPSEAPTDMSFKDRLQITLPPFDTSTPLLSVPPTPLLTGQSDTKPSASHASESEAPGSVGQERNSILKTLSNLWAYRTGDVTLLEYPLSASEHVFTDSRIIVREDEPTSIIAFTLASKTYRDRMRSVSHARRDTRRTDATTDSSAPSTTDETASVLSINLVHEDAYEGDENGKREGGTHINYDIESGSSTISCRIFYAERFAALRSSCGCEDRFIDSLARCIKFDSSGGKSGSAFLKTKDDRFIAKEVSRLELDALTKFAPSYFEYMKQSIQHNRPTALAKIYGCFKIGYNNTTTGKAMRMNVVIMENLFYERRFDRIYDLKGSVRNRLVQATGKENQVLLDENLMEVLNRLPLYMRDHCKQILRTALWNDTLFLSGLNVMDYSLVVGVDTERKELVVGVVDYIRTFTWDKKLESWVKDLGGGGRGEPTIVTPKQYKVRFRTAMEKYFPAVPDRWTRITNDNNSSPNPDEDVAQAL